MVTKVHRVLTFKQSPTLKTYIDFNTRQRTLAGNCSFLKDLFKLMNNSVLGKTQENLRNRGNVELVTDTSLLRKRVAKPTFCRGKPIADCLTVIQSREVTLTLNRPIYVGFTVLKLSKLHMNDFHCNHMRVKYPRANQLLLLFTDTDSLAYAVQTDDIYRDMATDAADRYDFSEYSIDYPLYDVSNPKALGFFKDEENSVPMQKFVGLRPKCYAFHCTGTVDKNVLEHTGLVEKKTAKGIKRKVKADHLDFVHYLDTLRSFKSYVCKKNLISPSAHTIRTTHTRKVGLTAFDTKRWLCEDTVHTHSHGHKDTVSDPMYLVNRYFIIGCITDVGVFNRSDLSGTTTLQPEQLESESESDSPYWDRYRGTTTLEQSESDSPYWDGFSQDPVCDPSFDL